MAGPNGSGKTTFAESFLLRTQRNAVFLNPDLIAAGIGPLDFGKASFHAGRLLISEIKNRIELVSVSALNRPYREGHGLISS